MSSLFRRKSANLVEEATTEVTPDEVSAAARRRGHTPSKRELGQATPKRPSAQRRSAAHAKPLTKEEAREQRRRLRAESAAEFRTQGGPRDRSPERGMVRDLVDSRRNVGTWFFGGALIVFIGASQVMPPIVQLISNVAWVTLALAVVLDSVVLCRRIKKLIQQRFPRTDERMGSLYTYAIMRSINFRRMRVPVPRVKLGDKI